MKLWVRLDADSPRDPRVGRLGNALEIPKKHAFGLIISVWCAMAEHAPDGDLSEVDDGTLEEWAGWNPDRKKDRGRFASAFRSVFAATGSVPEYADQQGALLRRMARDRQRHTNDPQTETPRKQPADSAETGSSFRGDSTSTERNGTELRTKTQQHSTTAGASRDDSAVDPAEVERAQTEADAAEHAAAVALLLPLEFRDDLALMLRRVRPTIDSPVESRRLSWAMSLRSLLDPDRTAAPSPPAAVGAALRQFNANGGSLNWRSFTLYVESIVADMAHAAGPPGAAGGRSIPGVALVRGALGNGNGRRYAGKVNSGDATFANAIREFDLDIQGGPDGN